MFSVTSRCSLKQSAECSKESKMITNVKMCVMSHISTQSQNKIGSNIETDFKCWLGLVFWLIVYSWHLVLLLKLFCFVFKKKNQYIDNVSDIPLMSLKVSWMSFLDYLLIKVTMCTIHFIVSFIELQKCQTKKSLEWRIPYNYAPLWSQSCSGSLTFRFSIILMSQPINPLD